MAAKDIVSGITGDVTASGFNVDVDAWTAEIQVDETAYRTFSSPWKRRKNVAYSMQGQFTGVVQFDAADTKPVPSSTGGTVTNASFEGVSLTLTAHTGCTYTGTANITGVSLERGATGEMKGTYRFAFDGQPSETWDETGS